MDTLRQVESLLATLSPTERALLLRRVMDDLSEATPGIETTSSVCGGAARIAGTRIPIWLLEQARRSGATADELLQSFPTLSKGDLDRAWAYVAARTDEIDQLIRENEAA